MGKRERDREADDGQTYKLTDGQRVRRNLPERN